MTKEEKIQEAAEKYASTKSSSEVFKRAHIEDFISGANWTEECKWIKIESEADLPKENGEYWTAIGDNPDEVFINNFVEKKYFKWRHVDITHYQPTEMPKPPLF